MQHDNRGDNKHLEFAILLVGAFYEYHEFLSNEIAVRGNE